MKSNRTSTRHTVWKNNDSSFAATQFVNKLPDMKVKQLETTLKLGPHKTKPITKRPAYSVHVKPSRRKENTLESMIFLNAQPTCGRPGTRPTVAVFPKGLECDVYYAKYCIQITRSTEKQRQCNCTVLVFTAVVIRNRNVNTNRKHWNNFENEGIL